MPDNMTNRRINLLDYPILFMNPEYINTSAWLAHVPLAMLLIDLMKPHTFVELNSYGDGVSYFAFCQAVQKLNLDTLCHAVDMGEGAGDEYGEEGLAILRHYHDPRYGAFSRLINTSFDDALAMFPDNSIDLLHINSGYIYEDVKNIYETWLPKLSSQGIIVMHYTNEYHEDFGVWKLWQVLKNQYPTFEVLNGHGLGVIAIGSQIIDEQATLFEMSDEDQSALNRVLFKIGQANLKLISENEIQTQLNLANHKLAEVQNLLEILSKNKENIQTQLEYTLEKFEQQEVAYHALETEYRQILADLKYLQTTK